MKFDFKFKTLNKIYKTDLSVTIILLIGIIAVVNFFSYQIFYRFDLTQGKNYSISAASKKTASSLDDIVTIKAYFSSNLPSQFLSVRQEVSDLLGEYQVYSNGKIRTEFIDPGSNDEIKRELYLKGIPQLTFQVYAKDQMQTVNGYMGLIIGYGDNYEVIPAIGQSTGDLEYKITTAIKKATAKEIATIGYVVTNQTADPASETKVILEALQKLYKIEQVKLSQEDLASEIKTLIIFGPRESFTEDQLKTINRFLARGGSLLVLLDGVNVDQNLSAQVSSTNLDKFLAKYGIIVNKNLIADIRSSLASFSQGYMTFAVNYPYWLRITNDGFNANNSIVASLENVIMPWSSSITIDTGKINKEIATNLIFTTDKAWEIKDDFNLAPAAVSPGSKTGIYNIAVAVNGLVDNAYPDDKGEKQFNARLTVVGDSDFARDSFIGSNSDNANLFLNLVDGLSLDEDLINIRSKDVSFRPIKEGMSEGAKNAIRYFNIFGITILAISFGLARYYLRRRSKFIDEI
ncbi:MAG: ABC-type uncharacterized transport system [Parcubacteria group bacterium ADurb.Bin316]|nr:MAG: ABC-type uncharacterized transport system [Parcubacteria group bacterium ADurb.Bin316]HOZ56256.1 GldG family protein [bacterium]